LKKVIFGLRDIAWIPLLRLGECRFKKS
jgi:hypothetical protein